MISSSPCLLKRGGGDLVGIKTPPTKKMKISLVVMPACQGSFFALKEDSRLAYRLPPGRQGQAGALRLWE